MISAQRPYSATLRAGELVLELAGIMQVGRSRVRSVAAVLRLRTPEVPPCEVTCALNQLYDRIENSSR
jgi:hypothetical protein